jgi:hypothetical protein
LSGCDYRMFKRPTQVKAELLLFDSYNATPRRKLTHSNTASTGGSVKLARRHITSNAIPAEMISATL